MDAERPEPLEGRLTLGPAGSEELPIEAETDDARLLVLGGALLGERSEMWWNFVGRDNAEITEA